MRKIAYLAIDVYAKHNVPGNMDEKGASIGLI